MSIYQSILKPIMFRLDAEDAHRYTMALFRLGASLPGGVSVFRKNFTLEDDRLGRKVMGIHFKNPVGLAAGFDKDGKYIDLLPLLGFGFAEVGTVTPVPQTGNPRPRLFRLKDDEALINRMGFNNEGVMAMARRLNQRKNKDFVIGGNIGKNKDTPNEEAYKDYVTCFLELKTLVDFFVINVSSPNTPGLRELQNKESLKRIIGSIQDLNDNQIPVLLKIAPDISLLQLDDIIEVIEMTGLDGINCHNTTVRRDLLKESASQIEECGAGGLSGKPLNQMFSSLTKEVKNRLPSNAAMIASGGIHDEKAAMEKLKTGADLIEVYTGLIYQGPEFVRRILIHLLSQST